MKEISLDFRLLEDKKTQNLYMDIEDVLKVLRYYQLNLEEFKESDFTFVYQFDKKDLN